MLTLSIVKDYVIEKSRGVVKLLAKGRRDVRTSITVTPPNMDAPPIEGMRALYAKTGNDGVSVIVGYINENLKAEPGEYRIFSVDANGNEQTYIHVLKNGTIEIAGNSDNMVRYAPLDTALTSLQSQLDTELAKIQTAISGLGGTYPRSPITIDITQAKIEEVKTTSPAP